MLGNSSVPGRRRLVCVVININNTENLTGIALANRFVLSKEDMLGILKNPRLLYELQIERR